MKVRRLVFLTLALSLVAAGAVMGESMWGNYAGYSKAKVYVNDTELSNSGSVPAFVINGSTVLPLRQVAEAMNSIVKWDSSNQTANIYKPNVALFVAEKVTSSNEVKKPFGKVTAGIRRPFDVFAQVDNLKVNATGVRISIVDPYGSEVDRITEGLSSPGSNFWFTTHFEIKFSETGNYKVRFAVEVDGTYHTVEEKLIVSE